MRTIAEIAVEMKPGKEWYGEDLALPNAADRVTLDQLDPKHDPLVAQAIQAARNWASRKIGGWETISLILVASGVELSDGRPDPMRTGYGCGKTHIARAIQWASYFSLDDGTPIAPAGKFYTAHDLMELLGSGNSMRDLAPPFTDTSAGRMDGTPVLVIDDVGVEGTLPYIAVGRQEQELQARYFEVVNYCYTRKISVVITANMRVNELAQHVGGRAWSRLQEMAPSGFIVDMTGVPDYRRAKGGR
jgi:hypothetical protein